ncbi:unnamed protein product [Staurois parvus]|uniref:Uncharacterized protein n=1 Tax=Staurois parvus TaxID=386267 RepID=A0ABN9CMX1_9NEOB|nr:unnamed protein product [Staurois parvus]
MLSLVCIAREFFFFLGECIRSVQDHQSCPGRRSGVLQPHRTIRGE